ncbi:MAG TPA: hypothetical protein PKH33_07035 [bacterium]|nr:hypothetical protein [bacterium]
MAKITPRQEKILSNLADIVHGEIGEISLPAARGIMHFAIESVCSEWGIDLAQAEVFEIEKRKKFFSELMENVGQRISRYHVRPDKVEEILQKLFEEYSKH